MHFVLGLIYPIMKAKWIDQIIRIINHIHGKY